MAAPVPIAVETFLIQSGSLWDTPIVLAQKVEMNDLVVVIAGSIENVGELDVEWVHDGPDWAKEFETTLNTPRCGVYHSVPGMGVDTSQFYVNGTFDNSTQDIVLKVYIFRGDWDDSPAIHVSASNQTASSVTAINTGVTPATTIANAYCIAMLNDRFGDITDVHTIDNSFGNIEKHETDTGSLTLLVTADKTIGATGTVEANWGWDTTNSAAAGIIVIAEGSGAAKSETGEAGGANAQLDAEGGKAELDKKAVNPANITPKDQKAMLVSFHWGRGSDIEAFPHVRGYTDWTSDVGIGADNYIAAPTVEVAKFKIHGATEDTPIKIRMPKNLAPADTLARPYPHAPVRVRIAEVDPSNPTQTYKELFVGDITNVSSGRFGRASIVQFEVSSMKERMNVPLGIVCDTFCAWRLGDKNCCVKLGELPLIEDQRRFMAINNNEPLNTSSEDLRERMDNIVLFDGFGEVVKVSSLTVDGSLGLRCLAVNQLTGDYAVGGDGNANDKGAFTYFNRNGSIRWKYASSTGDAVRMEFMPNGDLIVFFDNITNQIRRFQAEDGVEVYAAAPGSQISSHPSYDMILAADGFLYTAHYDTGAPAGECGSKVDPADGSTVESYDNPTIINQHVTSAVATDGTRVFFAQQWNGSTNDLDVQLIAFDIGTPGTPLWKHADIWTATSQGFKSLGVYGGSLWAVGMNPTSGPSDDKNLWEFNPLTGAILNSWDISNGQQLLHIEIDQATGLAIICGDASSGPNPGRYHLVNLGVAPGTILESYEDTLGNYRDPVMTKWFPLEVGDRILRTIASVNETVINITADVPDPMATGKRFVNGYFEFDGIKVPIRDQISLTSFQLVRNPPPEWVATQQVTMTPGCDKDIDGDCRNEYDNEEFFGGFGNAIPKYNPLLEQS